MGYWLGVADHVGDRFCYHILTADTHRVIERSVIRSAEYLPNKTLHFPPDEFEPEEPVDDPNHVVEPEAGEVDGLEEPDDEVVPTYASIHTYAPRVTS